MPQKNGLAFLRELRNERNETLFVMFTGRGSEEVAVNALNLGTDQYVNKHVRRRQFLHNFLMR